MKYDILRNIFYKFISIIYWVGVLIFTLIFIRIFCFRAFEIPSNSMSLTVTTGDHIIVNKMIPGACLFDIFSYMKKERVAIMRAPGIAKIRRNDVIVFNFPYPNDYNKIEMFIIGFLIRKRK